MYAFIHFWSLLIGCGLLFPASLAAAELDRDNTISALNLTTVTARNGLSLFECWSFPFSARNAPGGGTGSLNLLLGETENATYVVMPARHDGGLHNAPSAQLVAVISGLAHLTLPNQTALEDNNQVWMQGGKYGLIVALDTADVSVLGHLTNFPSAASTISLQIPFKTSYLSELYGRATVLHDGPCTWSEMAEL